MSKPIEEFPRIMHHSDGAHKDIVVKNEEEKTVAIEKGYTVHPANAPAPSPGPVLDPEITDNDYKLENFDRLAREHASISDQNSKLTENLVAHAAENGKLTERIARVSEENQKLSEEVAKLTEQNNNLAAENGELREKFEAAVAKRKGAN